MSGIDNEGLRGPIPPAPPRLVDPRAHHVACNVVHPTSVPCVVDPAARLGEYETVDGQAMVKRHHIGCGVDHPFYSECVSPGGSKLGIPRPQPIFTEGALVVAPAVDEVIVPLMVDRVAVGGPLHGKIVRVPIAATHLVSARSSELIADGFRAMGGVTVYLVRDRSKARLVIEADTLASGDRAGRSNRLGETIVDALAIASGAHGIGGPLVATLPPPDFDD